MNKSVLSTFILLDQSKGIIDRTQTFLHRDGRVVRARMHLCVGGSLSDFVVEVQGSILKKCIPVTLELQLSF